MRSIFTVAKIQIFPAHRTSFISSIIQTFVCSTDTRKLLLFQQRKNGFRCCGHLGYRAETGAHVF